MIASSPLRTADECAMGPGAGKRDVEVIASKLGGKASMTRGTGCAIDRHPVAVGAILAQETSPEPDVSYHWSRHWPLINKPIALSPFAVCGYVAANATVSSSLLRTSI